MKVTTEELARCEISLIIEFDPKKEQDLLTKAAKRIAREVKVPGFRPGKAPFNTIIRRFGLEVVQQEALENISDNLIRDALKEADVEPVAQIQVEDVGWDPLVLKLKVPTQPKVELADYREIRLEPESVEVTDEDVDDILKEIQEQTATWVPVERPSQLGDLISMTATKKDGDETLSENESDERELIAVDEGEEISHPDFTTPLLGLSAGDTKTFTVTYPEDFDDERYAGKEITVNAEISGVKEKELDPLDDEFAREMSDFETLDELKEDIRQNLLEQRHRRRDMDLGTEMLDKILEDRIEQLEWPVALEDEGIDEEIERAERQLKNMGLTLDSYLQMQSKSIDEWREELRPRVAERLKKGLVLSKIAELEELEVSQGEILQQAKALADYSGGGDQLWQAILSSQIQQGAIANDVLSNKAILRLGAIAKGEAPEPGAENNTDEGVAESVETDEEVVMEDEAPEAEATADQEETETEVSEQA